MLLQNFPKFVNVSNASNQLLIDFFHVPYILCSVPPLSALNGMACGGGG